MTETRCNSCGFEGHERRGTTHNPGWQCPWCGAGLFRRVAAPVRLSTHASAVVRGVISLRGVLFVGFYVALSLAPIPFSGLIAACSLAVVSLRFAHKSMLIRRGEIEFPELDADDIFNLSWFLPAVVYGLAVALVPAFLLGLAVALDGALRTAAIAGLVLAILYAPMALVSILRTGSTWSLLSLPTGVRHILSDPLSYLGLVLAFAVVKGADIWLSFTSLSVAASLAALPGTVFLHLLVFGLAGLWVRQHARRLDVACDDDDWKPIYNAEVAAFRRRPALVVRKARSHEPIALPSKSGELELTAGMPLVAGQPLPPVATASPAPLDLSPLPNTNP